MKDMFRKVSLRTVAQVAIVSVVAYLSASHMLRGVEQAAPIDAYCPLGAVESFFTLVFKGEFLKRVFMSSFILLIVFLVATLVLGRVFCGWFCPLGAVQEWMRTLGRKFGIRKDVEIPEKFDRYFRYVKYVVLAVIVYYSFSLGDLVFRAYDPYNALMHFGNEFAEKPIGYTILAVLIVGSLFSKSLWCRYFCPLGAFFGLVKKVGFFRIRRDASTCVGCARCDKNCPANLKIATADVIDSADCVSCGKCVGNCPKGSLGYTVFGKRVSKGRYAMLVAIVVVLPLVVLPFTPLWKTKPESNIVNVRGEVNVADIRGSNTLEYVIETTGVPFDAFHKELGLPKDTDLKLKLKDVGSTYNLKNAEGSVLETEDFRAVVLRHIPK